MAERQSQPPEGHPEAPPFGTGPSRVVRGSEAVAREALLLAHLTTGSHRVLVNGEPGLLSESDGHPQAVLSLTVRDGRIVEINVLADLARLDALPDPRLALLDPRLALPDDPAAGGGAAAGT